MLWEADPVRFAARYPDSGIEESYGDQWPPPCIDYWIYLDPDARVAKVCTEGWSWPDQEFALSGVGVEDADRLGDYLAQVLQIGT